MEGDLLLLALLLLLVLRRSDGALPPTLQAFRHGSVEDLEAHFEVGRSFVLCEALILTVGRVAFCFSPQVLCSPSSLIPGSPAYVVLHAIVSETPPRAGAWPWSLLRSHTGVLASATRELLRRAAYPFCLVDGESIQNPVLECRVMQYSLRRLYKNKSSHEWLRCLGKAARDGA